MVGGFCISPFGAKMVHATLGTGTKKGDSCIKEGRDWVTVQVVVCDPLRTTGKNYLSHTPALSLPAKALCPAG